MAKREHRLRRPAPQRLGEGKEAWSTLGEPSCAFVALPISREAVRQVQKPRVFPGVDGHDTRAPPDKITHIVGNQFGHLRVALAMTGPHHGTGHAHRLPRVGRICPVAVCALALLTAALASTPCLEGRLSWASEPAFAGDTILLQGSCLARAQFCTGTGSCANATVQSVAGDLSSGAVVVPRQPADSSPAAAAALTLSFGRGGATWAVNQARPWWHLGSRRGNTTSAGGWLRVFGQNLAFGGPRGCSTVGARDPPGVRSGTAQLHLRPVSSALGGAVVLNSTNATCFSAFFRIPASVVAGTYAASVRNDLPGSPAGDLAGSVVVAPADPWPAGRHLNVAAGDGAALLAALASVGAGGGGVVTLGAGATAIGPATLSIPDGVTLEGSAGGGTVLTTNTSGPTTALTVGPTAGVAGGRARLRGLTVQVDSPTGTVVEIPAGTWGSEVRRRDDPERRSRATA